jgi:hypothetical protein
LQELKKHLSTMPYYSLEEFLNTEQIWDEYQCNYETNGWPMQGHKFNFIN